MAEIHEQAKRDYISGMKYQDIADKYKVTINTVKSWKMRHGWERSKKGAHKQKKGCTKKSAQVSPAVKAVFSAPTNEALTEKEQLFCRFFVNNRNATQAAIKAGYSTNTASVIGYENLNKPHIRAEIERLRAIRNQSIMLSEDDIVERRMRIAFADITDFAEFGIEDVPIIDPATGKQVMNDDGSMASYKRNYLNFKNSDQVDGGLISEIKTGKQGMSVKLADQQKALDWLSDYFEINPANKHRQWFDKQKLDFERRKVELLEKESTDPADKPINITIKRKAKPDGSA
jgi:phage terminase small subunit